MATHSGLEEFCGGTFWDLNTTWYTDNPDFTLCFEKTVLVWIPCFYLWLVAPLQIKDYMDSLDRLVPWSFINVTKLILSAILLILQVMEIGYQIDTSNRSPEVVSGNDYLAPSLLLVTLLMQTVFVVMEKKRGIQSSGYIAVFWLLMTICGVFQYRTYFNLYEQMEVETLPFVIYNIQFPVVVIITVLNCFADATPKILAYPRGPKASPVLEASFISKLFFSWLTPLVWRGYKKPIEHSDLYDLTEDNTARAVVKEWSNHWEKSVQKATSKQKPKTRAEYFKDYNNVEVSQIPEKPFVSVLPTMVRTFGVEFLVGTAMKIVSDVLQFVSPQILSLLISYTEDEDIEVWKGYFYAVVMFITTMIMSLLVGQYSIRMYVVGAKMRTGITTSVYRKALKISNAARKESTVGEIVNLMAVDSQRFMDFTTYMNMLISAPLTIGLAIYFLYQILGPSSLAGLATLIILIPTNGFIGNEMKKLQIEQMKYKDKRVKMMNEILNGMKVLKLYAWEPSFEKQVLELRHKEIKVLRKTAYYNAVMSFLFTCTPFLVTLTMFLTFVYSSSENKLTADIIFVSMSLMNILKLPLFMVPFLLVTGIQTSVSLKRLNKFLNADELDLTAVTSSTDEGVDIAIKDASFAWGNEDEDKNILSNINMTVKTGSLVAVVGVVGSGKTSLCSALLGAMYKRKGTVDVKDKMAYVSQQAWIQNKLLKDNILFGTPYDEKRYQDTLHACSLVEDLAILPAGDNTEIGEKGINLSGGQKQRVSLARAVYSDASIYLLDDPLSAVDSHVGKHIFTHVISNDTGMLQGKTRILVTNALTYLPSVDHIVVIDDGTISEQGSYQELVSKQGKFQEFLLKYLAEAEEDEEDDPELAAIKAQLQQVVDPKLIEKAKTVSESEKSDKGSVRRRNVTKPDAGAPAVQKPAVVGQTLIEAEKSETGKVKGRVYLGYFQSVGVVIMLLTVLFYIGSQTAIVMSNLWLTKWAEDDNSTLPAVRDKYMGVYGALGVAQAVFVMLATLLMTKGTIVASWDLNKAMLANIMRSAMSFFDITPTGRIVNRFSKDLDTIDTLLPMNLRNLIQFTISVVATFLVIIVATPYFTVVLVPCIGIYYFMQNVYVTTSRQLKRIESVTRSPIYSHFGESVQGTATIRAYGKEEEFILESQMKVDSNQKSYLPSVVSNRWLSIRLEFIGNILTFFAAVFAVLAKQSDISSGVVGLSISYAQSVTLLLYFVVRMAADVETNIVSVERVKEYCETETEAAWEIQNKQTQKDWPEEGVVEFTKFATRYREGLDLVVKDIDITIKSGEKVGIVGRTGAGKSSLTLSLFRIIEAAAGHIIIDGINIAEIGLHNLRSRLTIIPQDPVLFSGSLRFNLDPFDQYSDEAVWVAIELAHLKPFVSELAKGLQHEVTEGGENFSVGQRQLVCLARALLRKTRLLILDEATAAVDLETDDLIQKTIRKEFANCTVITIAHRLNTIMDSDRILVLDKGEVKEFSPPDDLLGDSSSLFYGMAKDAGLV